MRNLTSEELDQVHGGTGLHHHGDRHHHFDRKDFHKLIKKFLAKHRSDDRHHDREKRDHC